MHINLAPPLPRKLRLAAISLTYIGSLCLQRGVSEAFLVGVGVWLSERCHVDVRRIHDAMTLGTDEVNLPMAILGFRVLGTFMLGVVHGAWTRASLVKTWS